METTTDNCVLTFKVRKEFEVNGKVLGTFVCSTDVIKYKQLHDVKQSPASDWAGKEVYISDTDSTLSQTIRDYLNKYEANEAYVKVQVDGLFDVYPTKLKGELSFSLFCKEAVFKDICLG